MLVPGPPNVLANAWISPVCMEPKYGHSRQCCEYELQFWMVEDEDTHKAAVAREVAKQRRLEGYACDMGEALLKSVSGAASGNAAAKSIT